LIYVRSTKHHVNKSISSIYGDSNELWFEYEKKKFFYDRDKKIFVKLRYPINGEAAGYFNHPGLTSNASQMAEKQYGLNAFDIPIPSFQELFQEHAMAPFFVFQVFCVGLWFMDEYWYYSLFTLAMLFVFESTVVQQVNTLTY
jgi:manganese-transporting P-type ATPase